MRQKNRGQKYIYLDNGWAASPETAQVAIFQLILYTLLEFDGNRVFSSELGNIGGGRL